MWLRGLRTILSAATLRRPLLAGTSLPVFIEADIIRGEVGQNCPPQFKDIHATQILVENSTVSIEVQKRVMRDRYLNVCLAPAFRMRTSWVKGTPERNVVSRSPCL